MVQPPGPKETSATVRPQALLVVLLPVAYLVGVLVAIPVLDFGQVTRTRSRTR